jgi:drug/metabolite transporter (DMT)-like permease
VTTSERPAAPAVSPGAALGVAIAAVSTSAILVRWSAAPSLVAAFYRVALTVALLAPAALYRHGGEFRRVSRRDLLGAIVAGVALAVHFGSWFQSIRWTSVAASTTLVQSQVLFVALAGGLLLGERLGRRAGAGIALAGVGMAVMFGGELLSGAAVAGPRPLAGNALAVVGAATAAVYVLAGRSLRQRISLLPYVTVVYGVCAAVLLGLVLAAGRPLAYPPREWLIFLAMAVGPGVFGHTVLNWALGYLRSSVVSVSLLGEPAGSALLALVLLSEVPGPATLFGGVVVLAGISLTAGDADAGSGAEASAAADG